MNTREFRDAMGKFSTGVTVVATEMNGHVHGMTANAFMSVSLEPKLIVISVMNDANTLTRIKQTKNFTVSILSENQKEISNTFASKTKSTEGLTFNYLDGLPVIPGAIAQVACEVSAEHVEGDHTLFIGRVTEFRVQEGNPLIFSEGRYRKIEEQVTSTI
ncbi:flavin reductase family protein [Aquibacillus saliphilus]|uniref:flavin reductase family protein n=1 Tax=Aquibacillus saliphilus TaxID=1909422 RepID=UPI001CF07F6F|nr:flavin reductase family protein [Aquibacillus saliphilus]